MERNDRFSEANHPNAPRLMPEFVELFHAYRLHSVTKGGGWEESAATRGHHNGGAA